MTLTATTTGHLRFHEQRLYVTTHPPRRTKVRDYLVPDHVLVPKGLPPQQLDGLPATIVWNFAEGQIIQVEAEVPEHRPAVLTDTKDTFLNPYGFVSIPDRADLPPGLGDEPPTGHDRYRLDRWTGTIEVTMTTRTPLLLPDHARAAAMAENATALGVRADHKGRPLLAGSAIKGALRSSYEAITNSRFGVFNGHDERLAIRANADQKVAESLRSAVVTGTDAATVNLHVVHSLRPTVTVAKQPTMVCVPRQLACHNSANGCRRTPCRKIRGRHCEDLRTEDVEAWVYLVRVGTSDKFPPHWRVASYGPPGTLGPQPTRDHPRRYLDGRKSLLFVPDQPYVRVRGRLHWNGSTFPAGGDKKYDERLVVTEVLGQGATLDARPFAVDASMVEGWQAVIDSYDRAHLRDKSRDTHYGDYVVDPARWRDLVVGRTLFVELDNGRVTGLYPSMIGRKPYPGAPSTSLPTLHRPATDREQLSPADRVFGWVGHGRDGDGGIAHRGHLRVIAPRDYELPGPDSIQHLGQRLPLVTLNSPKPAQMLFYLGQADGAPLRSAKKDVADGYPSATGQRRLRGRKVYLTQAEVLADTPDAHAYWTPPVNRAAELVHVDGRPRYREYIRPGNARTDSEVTTYVDSWVKPGTEFRFTLQVDNLTATELGALLWLLDLPGGASHKLGLGKPLGFGAVRMDVDWTRTLLYTGEPLRDRYRTLKPTSDANEAARLLSGEYDKLLRDHLRGVRAEFLNAASGFIGSPVHYPRRGDAASAQTGPQGNVPSAPRTTTYDWWTDNDKVGDGAGNIYGRRIPLGRLDDPQSMLLPGQPIRTRPGVPQKRKR